MGSSASAANMGHGLNTGMPGLGACAMPDSKPMQFPLAQRRKRRVLFTQAQVRHLLVAVPAPPRPRPARRRHSTGAENYFAGDGAVPSVAVGHLTFALIFCDLAMMERLRCDGDGWCCRCTSWRGGSSSRSICRRRKGSTWRRLYISRLRR